MTISVVEVMSDTAHLSKEKIQEVIKAQEDKILYIAYILHDKDKFSASDEEEETARATAENRPADPNIKVGSPKNPHFHIMIMFNENKRPSSFKTIANWFGLEENFIRKCSSKKKTLIEKYGDMCAYLLHLNAPEKHQYDLSEVWANFDLYDKIEKWKSTSSFSQILRDILDGKITENNYTNFISGELYTQYKSKIEAAFAFCRDKNKTLNREMDVLLIYGPGGVGKTTYAKMLAQAKGYDPTDIFVSSSGEDILYGYRGEHCIIIDDFRREQMTFVEFLKMTDNNTNSAVRSRYANKDISNCKLMIVTSIHHLGRLYAGTAGEDMVQLFRRFRLQLRMDADTITPFVYVKSLQRFLPTKSYSNPVQQLVEASKTDELKTRRDVYNYLVIPYEATEEENIAELGEEQDNSKKTKD